MASPDVKAMMRSIRANMHVLDECKGPHEFEVIGEQRIGAKYKCKKCGGRINSIHKMWYEKGLKHGRG